MGGGQGGCERRTEVFVKIQKKKIWGGGVRGGVGLGSGWGVRVEGGGGWGVGVDVIQELKFFGKFKKKIGGGGWGGVGLGGQGGCERRIEVFVKIQKKKFFFWGGGGGGGGGRGRVGGSEWMGTKN